MRCGAQRRSEEDEVVCDEGGDDGGAQDEKESIDRVARSCMAGPAHYERGSSSGQGAEAAGQAGEGSGEAAEISRREHGRAARERFEGEGTYSEARRRAPKRPREEGAAHRWQMVHIAPAKRRMMDRMAKLAKGDG